MIRLVFSFLLAASAVAAHAVLDAFDGGGQGWRTCDFDVAHGVFGNFVEASWSSTGGHPGGALVTKDVDDYCFLAAPTPFLGDQSGAFGTSLTYDTYSSDSGSAPGDGPYPAVVLTSGATILYNTTVAPGTDWTSVSIPLVGSAWSLSPDTLVPVTDAAFKGVLANLSGLYVQADWLGLYETETTGLDNVRLETVPEPASLAALGLGALAFLRRRR